MTGWGVPPRGRRASDEKRSERSPLQRPRGQLGHGESVPRTRSPDPGRLEVRVLPPWGQEEGAWLGGGGRRRLGGRQGQSGSSGSRTAIGRWTPGVTVVSARGARRAEVTAATDASVPRPDLGHTCRLCGAVTVRPATARPRARERPEASRGRAAGKERRSRDSESDDQVTPGVLTLALGQLLSTAGVALGTGPRPAPDPRTWPPNGLAPRAAGTDPSPAAPGDGARAEAAFYQSGLGLCVFHP